ncbi:hypothetical protein FACS1894137_17700 [Spirochaetia bacterium]|nr:hypothetical protein FACS1894137_17700 [Spirochaetia bacterium]
MEAFLRSREQYCVAACAKFLHSHGPKAPKEPKDQAWYLAGPEGTIRAVLLRFEGMLFPVFETPCGIPPLNPSFLRRTPVRVVQGLRDDTELLEAALESLGCTAEEHRDYDLMGLEKPPEMESPPLRGLVLRKPDYRDLEEMLPLQAGYEKEEVIPDYAVFNPLSCLLNLSSNLAHEQNLIACLDDRIVGKINTNAASFSRIQIGGVYVLPEYRGLGIGRRMTAAFAGELCKQGRALTLFVNKNNPIAFSIYAGLGFSVTADYRISYYSGQ